MGSFLLYICDALLSLLSTVIIGNAILSWLVAFDVVNLRNRFVSSIADVLDAISRPVLAPFRRFIPPLGGVDITPVIALLVIEAARKTLLPLVFSRLI
jgi:YggT family protein